MNLDPQQKEAVETASRHALVLAGAGSGKTRVLIERIAELVESKVSPYEIMAFTFTRKAAGEIKSRLVERIGTQAYHCHLGTMHALALSMVKRFGEKIGLRPSQVTVYGDWEERYLLRDVAAEMGVYDEKKKKWSIPKWQVDKCFAYYYQMGLEPAPDDPCRPLFDHFQARCRENNSLTYGGLLIGLRLLVPTMARLLHVEHILVDEVQDIDTQQWEIIMEMCEAFGADLFVVGDIDQSIYGFRGAVPEFLVEFQSQFEVYRIENNYRSYPDIVAAANRLIEHNFNRIPKTMNATRPELADCCVEIIPDQQSEQIVDLAKAWRAAGEPVAILARNHALLIKVDNLMSAENVPHVYIGKESNLVNSGPFRMFHAFLKLLVNPYDNFAFLLLADVLKIPRVEYREIRFQAAQQGESHFNVWNADAKIGFFQYNIVTGQDIATVAKELSELFNWPFNVAPILDFISYTYDKGDASVADYLDWLATYDVQDEIKAEECGITLMTIHAAKGLEYPAVIVAGCNEGIIPSKQAVEGGDGDIEEERRLMYVAMTRAMNQLILTVRPEKTEGTNGHIYENPVSRFIHELGE
jgi:DNA helicase-2/ATP-dependent DNA helicase PcrA